jgi:hypothetical protein
VAVDPASSVGSQGAGLTTTPRHRAKEAKEGKEEEDTADGERGNSSHNHSGNNKVSKCGNSNSQKST